jgi:hypothetical protein
VRTSLFFEQAAKKSEMKMREINFMRTHRQEEQFPKAEHFTFNEVLDPSPYSRSNKSLERKPYVVTAIFSAYT